MLRPQQIVEGLEEERQKCEPDSPRYGRLPLREAAGVGQLQAAEYSRRALRRAKEVPGNCRQVIYIA
eukprot:COSAG05_NODE_2268_length_3305_cov_7.375546_1_plen_67_part_00